MTDLTHYRYSTKYASITVLLLTLLTANHASALFGSNNKWNIGAGADESLLTQVNQKTSKNSKWFKEFLYPEPLNQRIERAHLPEELVTYVGRDISLINAPAETAYLESVIQRLAKGWQGPKVPYAVLLEGNRIHNLKVDSNNQIIMTTAYFADIKHEDTLAFLLAHELAHILLKHNQGKQVAVETIPHLLDDLGGLAILNERSKAVKEGEEDKAAIKKANTHTQLAGWLWSDLMTPIRSRRNEQEADYLAIDLIREAGYSLGKINDALKSIKNVNESLSERMESLRQILMEKIEQREKMQEKGLSEEQQAAWVGVIQEGAGPVLDKAFQELAKLRAEHAAVESRMDNAKEYIRKFHLRARPVKAHSKTLEKHQASKAIRSAGIASEVQKKLDSQSTIADILSLSQQAVSLDGNSLTWSSRYRSREKLQQFIKARQGLEVAIKNPLAHLSMYTKLAEYYLWAKRAEDTERVLQLGLDRLGPDRRLYIPMIKAAMLQGNDEKINRYIKACRNAGDGLIKRAFNSLSAVSGIKKPRDPCGNVTTASDQQLVSKSDSPDADKEPPKTNAFKNAFEKIFSRK